MRVMKPLLDRSQILAMWQDQNPALVADLRADGRLDSRLDESTKAAQAVALNALNRNLNQEQARELALDSVSLPTTPDETDLQEENQDL